MRLCPGSWGWGRAAATLPPPPLSTCTSPSLCSMIPSGPPCFMGNILSSSLNHHLLITKTLLPCRLVLSCICCWLRQCACSPAAPGPPCAALRGALLRESAWGTTSPALTPSALTLRPCLSWPGLGSPRAGIPGSLLVWPTAIRPALVFPSSWKTGPGTPSSCLCLLCTA